MIQKILGIVRFREVEGTRWIRFGLYLTYLGPSKLIDDLSVFEILKL